MAKYKVQDESGAVHIIEGPDDATPQEIESAAEQIIPKQTVQDPAKQALPEGYESTRGKAVASGVIGSIPFGADIAGAIGAGVYGGAAPDVPFWEKQAAAKQFFEGAQKQAVEDYPAETIGATIAGAAPLAAVLPVAKGGSVLSRAGRNALIGGGVGATYGAGQGQGEERIGNAIEQGVFGGATAGALSPVIDAAGAAIRSVPGLAGRAARLFGINQQSVPSVNVNIQPSQTTGSQIAASMQAGAPKSLPLSTEVIPLTKGQAMQGAKQQALEWGALSGNYGDEAQRLAEEARQVQSSAAKSSLSGLAGANLDAVTASEAAAAVKNQLSQSYKAAKATTDAAYKEVGELSQDAPLQIAGQYVRENVVGGIKDWARKGSKGRPWDLMRSDMGEAKRLYNQAAAMGDFKKISAINFFRMEDWRGRVSQAMAAAEKGSPSKAFLSGMLERYDRSMGQLPREAIKSGDDAILSAMEKARMARKTQGVLFERSKLVKDILNNEDLTQEQLGNTIMSFGPKSGSYVRDMIRSAGGDVAKANALKSDLKRGVLGSIYGKSLSSELAEGGTVSGGVSQMISFDKLATQMNLLLKNKTLVNQIFTAEEAKALDQIRNAASLIKSAKPGSRNYSNTAYTILNAIKAISPTIASANVAGIGAGTALKAAGQAGAENELRQALEPVLRSIASENGSNIINLGMKYGSRVVLGEASVPAVRSGVFSENKEK